MKDNLPFDSNEIQGYKGRRWGVTEYAVGALMVLLALMALAMIHLNISDYLDAQLDSIEQSL